MQRVTMGIVLVLVTCLTACQSAPVAMGPPLAMQRTQTAKGLGAGQGVEVRDGLVYLYGDGETGVILEYEAAGTPPVLIFTGRRVRLTRNGEDLIPHPTGLTHHPLYGTFIGNTVAGVGTIYQIDWKQAFRDGNLDRAVLHTIRDDAAVNGTRPEFVQRDGRWLIATADYGDLQNEVRLYDPQRLAEADRTTAPGVIVARYPCGPWVQNLCWIDDRNMLVLVQNQLEGLKWRLSCVSDWSPGAFAQAAVVDQKPEDELEGFHVLPDGRAVWLSSSRVDNLRTGWFGERATP